MNATRPVLLAVLLALLVPSVAQASDTQLSIMMDDDLLVYRDDQTRDATLRSMKGLGADAVRVTILWSVIAENAQATPALEKRFKRLGADDPRAYPKANWDRYDRLARACRTLAVRCFFNVTGPGPKWGHATPPSRYRKDARWWKPKPKEFYKFVQAVGKRFGGRYKDENDHRYTLPKVTFWSIWNEPNQGGWLRPQWLNGKPVSPQLYRELWFYGRRALESTGHGGDVILAGETAPINVSRKTTTSAMGPKTFVRELLCMPGTSGAGCSRFDKDGPIKTTAWAHHPYTKDKSPLQRESDPEAITLANFNELGELLDQGAAQTGHIASGVPLISTEFGYETSPPDPYVKTNPQQQALFNQLGDYLTYLNPRVVGNTQFLLRDVKPLRRNPSTGKRYKTGSRPYWGTYQSGLFTAGGTPKPAATAYAFPFLIQPVGANESGQTRYFIWGQIRFQRNGTSPDLPDAVQLEYLPSDGSSGLVPLGDPIPVTNPFGYFTAEITSPGAGLIRAKWSGQIAPFETASLPQATQP